MGGKEAASARYIYTSLNKLTRILFPESGIFTIILDDYLYQYLEDDG